MPTPSLKDAAVEFLKLSAAGRADVAFDRYAAPGFRHHNPYFPGDARSLRDAMQANAAQNPAKVLLVQRALQDGQEVVVFSRVDMGPGGPTIAVVHIFRFEDDRIAELWDIGQPVPDGGANENGMF